LKSQYEKLLHDIRIEEREGYEEDLEELLKDNRVLRQENERLKTQLSVFSGVESQY
jgi:regulator of replication initiation timing